MRPTAHQAIEYFVALLLVYTAIHLNEGALALFVVALVCAALGAVSPGRMAFRPVLGHRLRRIGDLLVAVGAVVAAVTLADGDMLAIVPLVVAAIVLVRVAFTTPMVVVKVASTRPSPLDQVQPHVNQVARAAGIFVRNRRARKDGEGS
jgi:hypothetical protein